MGQEGGLTVSPYSPGDLLVMLRDVAPARLLRKAAGRAGGRQVALAAGASLRSSPLHPGQVLEALAEGRELGEGGRRPQSFLLPQPGLPLPGGPARSRRRHSGPCAGSSSLLPTRNFLKPFVI